MICNLKNLLHVLPPWLSSQLEHDSIESLQELRLRLDQPPELIFPGNRQFLHQRVRQEDLTFCINTARRYSPWAAVSAADGYLTIPGGHRIGICGEAIFKNGQAAGMRTIHSLCIRIARDFPGLAERMGGISGSVLILGAPGWGKTTLLRDLIRQRAQKETVAVVDERGELFPEGFARGNQTDVLTGCPKSRGILQLLRTMGPQTIAVDEITSPQDCSAILEAFGCGVSLLATAHSGSLRQFSERPVYGSLIENRVFENVLILQEDQTSQVERMAI